MGNRLVIQVRRNNKFVAALYSHWAARDGDFIFNSLWNRIEQIGENLNFEEYQIEVVKKIDKVLTGYNSGFIKPGILIRSNIMNKPYISKESKVFLLNHPEFPASTDHNAFIAIDEKIWYLWDSIAESTYDINMGLEFDERITIKKLEDWKKHFEKTVFCLNI